MTAPYAELRHLVAEANHEIDAAGLVVHAFGNASQVERESEADDGRRLTS